MDEIIHRFSEPVTDQAGNRYNVVAFGKPDDLGHWIGWLEFTPVEGGGKLRTDRDTTQPERDDLEYWATGLELVYLDGALTRARAL